MVKYYKWGYSWNQIKNFYIQKRKEETDKTNQFCEFIVDLTNNVMKAFSGGSDSPDEVGLDTGEGSEDMSEEDKIRMIETLGKSDFYNLFPHLKPD